jgi:hypothetical protein
MKIKVPLQVLDLLDDSFHLLLDIKVGRKVFKVVLDTGASKTVFDQQLLLLANDAIVVTGTDKLSAGLGTLSMESSVAIIPELKIGKLKLTDFEVAVLDLSTINEAYARLNHPQVLGVLGGDILMKHQAVIDYGKRVMRLEK